jgi:hypothetical protein
VASTSTTPLSSARPSREREDVLALDRARRGDARRQRRGRVRVDQAPDVGELGRRELEALALGGAPEQRVGVGRRGGPRAAEVLERLVDERAAHAALEAAVGGPGARRGDVLLLRQTQDPLEVVAVAAAPPRGQRRVRQRARRGRRGGGRRLWRAGGRRRRDRQLGAGRRQRLVRRTVPTVAGVLTRQRTWPLVVTGSAGSGVEPVIAGASQAIGGTWLRLRSGHGSAFTAPLRMSRSSARVSAT